MFRRYNSGETIQNRTALDRKASPNRLIFDMDGDQPLDWTNVKLDAKNQANFSESQYTLALETTHINNKNSPVILLLLSNQHVINDYLSNPASDELTRLGYTVAVLEYPNYGTSLGRASLQSWLSASRGAVRALNRITQKKIYIVGHSVGGPLALQAAAGDDVAGKVAGVVTYGGFSNLYEMAVDQDSNFFVKLFAKPITFITLYDNIIDGIGQLSTLATKRVPILILHGQNDGAVPPRHTELYSDEISKIRRVAHRQPLPLMETKIFPDLYHEEINNFSAERPADFADVWREIGNFISKSSSGEFSVKAL